ncbi:hypothetical protein [Saccharothrix sp.]|uniref:hypothetical protein n=1 Tax=Saccharothrix sp. TaxID=1873460 RepID=UPI0028118630|nr:hypothetical protein [Saccharothrix sp.]
MPTEVEGRSGDRPSTMSCETGGFMGCADTAEIAYTRERLVELAEIEPRLTGVMSALSTCATRHGSAAETLKVEQLAQLLVRAAHAVEEFISHAGAIAERLEGRLPRSSAVDPSRTHTLVREIFGVESVRSLLTRVRAPGHPMQLADESLRHRAVELGAAAERAMTAYTECLRTVVNDLAETVTPDPVPATPLRP